MMVYKVGWKGTEMTYINFIKDQIKDALQQAEKYGYDQPLIEPTEIYELEAYLQDILGFIKFNEVVKKHFEIS